MSVGFLSTQRSDFALRYCLNPRGAPGFCYETCNTPGNGDLTLKFCVDIEGKAIVEVIKETGWCFGEAASLCEWQPGRKLEVFYLNV